MRDLSVAKVVNMRDGRVWPNQLRENASVVDVARAIHQARRFTIGLPHQDWNDVPATERLTYIDAATRAVRGVTHEQRELGEYVGAMFCCDRQEVEWFDLSASQQMDFLYSARDVITAYEQFMRGVAHPMQVHRARQARQLLREKWAAQDREVAQAATVQEPGGVA